MDPNELFNYAKEGMKLTALGGMGGIAYVGMLYIVQSLSKFSPKNFITSDSELEQILNEEATKLGINPDKIKFVPHENMGVSKKDETYFFFINKNSIWCNRSIIKHELYHIFKGDCDKYMGKSAKQVFLTPYYWFIAEPRATLYGAFGIKI